MEKKIQELKNDILGKRYSLSVALVSEKESKSINRRFRGKNEPANVLSFALSDHSGEIILCPERIKKETRKFGRNYPSLFRFMVIHGMLHLKGMRHGSKMETAERKYDQKYLNRDRGGNRPGKGHSRRVSKGRKKS